jgi:hypothetical protein
MQMVAMYSNQLRDELVYLYGSTGSNKHIGIVNGQKIVREHKQSERIRRGRKIWEHIQHCRVYQCIQELLILICGCHGGITIAGCGILRSSASGTIASTAIITAE